MAFIECGGNSAPLVSNEPVAGQRAGDSRARLLRRMDRRDALDAARGSRHRPESQVARSPKAPTRSRSSRSVPITKALDDAMIALYQNGERLMPGNGYPMRLLLPGWEGNMNVKWLRRIKLVDAPAMSYYEATNVCADPAGRKGVPVLLPPGGQVVHHASLARTEAERARASTRSPASPIRPTDGSRR